MNALARSIAAVKRSAGARAACVAALILLPAAGPARAQPATATAPAAPAQPERNIAGPGDYGLREKIVQLLGRDKGMAQEKFSLIPADGRGGGSRSGTPRPQRENGAAARPPP